MDSRFERLVRMAKEEFGVTIVKSAKQEKPNFESLFGISSETIDQLEVPYDNSREPTVLYYEGPSIADTEPFYEWIVSNKLIFLAA